MPDELDRVTWLDVWHYAREDRGRMIRLIVLATGVLAVIGGLITEVVVLT